MPTSRLTVTDADLHAKVMVAGPAFAHVGSDKALTVFVFDDDTSPEPTCDILGDSQLSDYAQTLKKGGWVAVTVGDGVRAPGRVAVKSYGMFVGDPKLQAVHMAGGDAKDVFFDVTKVDAKSVEGNVGSDPSSTTPASGTVVARMCP